uniref:UDP-glucuronosyltransferase n=1 Tax=Panagrellus redivivus TaxID=6233 RepID=A0A7E4VSV8_PANRE
MVKVQLTAFLLLALLAVNGTAFKILFFIPLFGISHVNFSGRLADFIAQAGHEVAVYQPVLDETIKSKGFKSLNITKYFTLPRNPGDYSTYNREEFDKTIWNGMDLSMMKKFSQFRGEFCEGIMNDKKNIAALKAENFDLVVTEWFEPCGFGLIEAIGAKKFVTTSSGNLFPSYLAVFGVKPHHSYSPAVMSTMTEKMGFLDRVKSFTTYISFNLIMKDILMGSITRAIQRNHPDFHLETKISKSAFVFVNSEDHVGFIHPRTPKMISIPNMDNAKPKPLPAKYADIIESPKTRGIVLFSFGSVVQAYTMPAHVKTAFLEAFIEFPDITFFWKYEKPEDGTAADIPNVFIDKWLPQRDLLHHPKMLAFITHGGQNSLNEAAATGVPLLALPVFADQPMNTALLTYRGMGFGLDHKTLTKEKVVEALQEILNNKKYKEKAQVISRMIQARPLSTKESFIKHIEFAAEFGDTGTLSAEGANQNVFVFYSLDVIGFLLAVVILVVLLLKWVVVSVVRLVKSKLVKTKKE